MVRYLMANRSTMASTSIPENEHEEGIWEVYDHWGLDEMKIQVD